MFIPKENGSYSALSPPEQSQTYHSSNKNSNYPVNLSVVSLIKKAFLSSYYRNINDPTTLRSKASDVNSGLDSRL